VGLIKQSRNQTKKTMKKLVLALVAFAVIGLSSCEKEEGATPGTAKPVKVSDRKEIAQWD
jgi:hypothetical protein